MIRTILAFAIATTLLVPATVLAQEPAVGYSAPYSGANDWNEEPNTLAGGCLTFAHGNPSACYPADNNGIAAAKAGGEPVKVLQAKWMPYVWPGTVVGGTWSGTGTSGLVNPDAANLFQDFTGSTYMTPGTQSTFTAFFGMWTDLDKDGIRDASAYWRHGANGHDRQVFVNADDRDACSQQATPTVDEDGMRVAGGQEGNLAPAIDSPVGVEFRCSSANEWDTVPGWATTKPEVIGYIAPSDGATGAVLTTVMNPVTPDVESPCPIFLIENEEGCDNPPGQQQPDITYTAGDFYGQGTYSWTGVFGFTSDGSILETKVITTISDPIVTTTGLRAKEIGPASLVDVDIYSAIDPTAEALYQGVLHDVVGATASGIVGPVNAAYDDACAASNDASAPTGVRMCGDDQTSQSDAVSGPQRARFFGVAEDRSDVFDYSDKHLFLDLAIRESEAIHAQATADNGGFFGYVDIADGDTQDNGIFCYDLSGTPDARSGDTSCGAAARYQVDGFFGVWQDLNGDGFVGNPAVAPGCPDAYNCGATQDPNEDLWSFGSTDEWTPQCLPGKSGATTVTLTTASGNWGPVGAYVQYDDESDLDSTQGARAQFNPYDDIARDASDGSLTLVASGPIEMTIVCTGGGYYASFEIVYVPGGLAEDITMTSAVFEMDLVAAGVPEGESIQDVDTQAAWAFA